MKLSRFRLYRYVLRRLVPPGRRSEFLRVSFEALGIDPLIFAYRQLGIFKWHDRQESGEQHVVSTVVPRLLEKAQRPLTLFDVGANKGVYTKMLLDSFPEAAIYCFEPNPRAFQVLTAAGENGDVRHFNLGFGAERGTMAMSTYASDPGSSHASLHPEVFTTNQKAKETVQVEVAIDTLDAFCRENDVERIDFLKIDTEGHEHAVLQGASDLLASGRVRIVQLEFGECLVPARVFLKDLYELLTSYSIFRLDTDRLIPLFEYDVRNEIFVFQNLLAVHEKVDLSPIGFRHPVSGD